MRLKRILIWGTGRVAERVINNGINGEIIGFIETKKSNEVFHEKKVYDCNDTLPEYDYIIVANIYSNEIYKVCKEKNINLQKVIFLRGIVLQIGECNQDSIREILGEKNYTDYCSEYKIIENTFFKDDLKKYQEMNKRNNFAIKEQYLWPIIKEKYAMAGVMRNYFWQDLWAARLIYESGVENHFDIGSRIDGFIAHLLSMNKKVTLIDIREFPGEVENLYTIVDDATNLKQVADNTIESMSALCSLEHFGLGRYGDLVDPEACFKCFKQMQKKMVKGGNLYISLPIGKERVEFNAHRVFFPSTVIEEFNNMELVEFSCTAQGKIEYYVDVHKYDDDLHNGEYRYGLFHFVKK